MRLYTFGIHILTTLGFVLIGLFWLSSSEPQEQELKNTSVDNARQSSSLESLESHESKLSSLTKATWPEIHDSSFIQGLDFSRQGLFWQKSSMGHQTSQMVDFLMESMTDEEIVSQVFLLGWDSEFPEGVILDWIRQRNIGGIKIFGWNGRNIERMTRTIGVMQELALETRSGIPMFTATDQEGGWVRHIKDTTSITPGNMALGASRLPADSFLSGYFIGQELRAMGVNMNFAPTVDIYRNPEAHVIGPRAFSSEIDLTSLLGLSFFYGMEHTRVISTAKHFPGHGNATGDSHGEMPIVPDTWEDLTERDLVPFQVLIDAGMPAVLTGHLSFPYVTGDYKPASLSSVFKYEVLRSTLSFEGLAITDDLYMEGAWEYGAERNWTIAEITLEALRAGNDLVMLSQTPALNDRVWDMVFQEYLSNEEFRNGIKDSVRRILTIKYRYLYPDNRVPLIPDPAKVYDFVPFGEATQFFSEQAARSVFIISDSSMPLTPSSDQRVLLMGPDPDFFRIGRQFFPGAQEYRFPYVPMFNAPRSILEAAPGIARDFDYIVFNMANPNSAQVLHALRDLPNAGKRIFVLSILTPAYLAPMDWVENSVAVFGWGLDSFDAGFSVITGQIPGTGVNPIPHIIPNRQP